MTWRTLAAAALALAAASACETRPAPALGSGAAPVGVGALDAPAPRADTPALAAPARALPAQVVGATPRARVALRATLAPLAVTSVTELGEVALDVEVEGVAGPAELAVEFIAPGGEVFDRQARTLEGSAFELQQARFALPVAGTQVDQLRLTGQWQARVFLGGRQVDAQSFGLTP